MDLSNLGYQHYLRVMSLPETNEPIARVVAENKTDWTLITNTGEQSGIMLTTQKRKFKAHNLPKVGDFVTYEQIEGEDKVKIITVLPRFSQITRLLSGKRNQYQVLAANVDKMLVIIGTDQEFNPSQLGRYLALATQSSVEPIVVINKIDRGPEFIALEDKIHSLYPDLPTVNTSAKTKVGLDALMRLLAPEETAIFSGVSGSGKTSLINALFKLSGKTKTRATGAVGKTGKGRHTTTRREVLVLPSAAIVIDTPGLRTLEIPESAAAANLLFPDLERLTHECKFRNCDHERSEGCAIREALDAGDINERQYQEFLKLGRDNQRREAKTDMRKAKQGRAKVKALQKGLRQIYKTRKPSKK